MSSFIPRAMHAPLQGEISRAELGMEWEALRQAGRLLVSDRVILSVGVMLTRESGAGSAR